MMPRQPKTPPTIQQLQARFWAKVKMLPEDQGGHWVWLGAKTDGYGSFWDGCVAQAAHILAYLWIRGEYDRRHHLDHTCRVRHCVRPNHLEPVTNRENTIRGYQARRDAKAAETERELAYA
jgi:hypothetical protein